MEACGIPVFDGEGYEIWSKKMKTLFVSLELWDLLEEEHNEESYEGFVQKDSKTLYLIQQGVSNSIFPVIMNAERSKEAWDAIRDHIDHSPQLEEVIKFILKTLHDQLRTADKSESDKQLKTLILKFLRRKYLFYKWPKKLFDDLNVDDKYHLLDIAHKTLCSKREEDVQLLPSSEDKTFCFVNSATRLKEGNVRLKAAEEFGSMFDITFSNGQLMIPCIVIDYHFEVDIRNFIALELSQPLLKKRYYCDYVVFMDHLIASSSDVELLMHRDIISNKLIDAKFVDNMFTKLTRHVVTSDPYTYNKISKDLKEYCDRRRNVDHNFIGSFKQKYFQSPWTLISAFAAFLLLALTITQTVFTIIK